MDLPHPKEKLAECVWLPRLVAKTRAFLSDELPSSYRIALGSRIGIDGYFLRHFRLTMPQMIAAIRRAPTDKDIAAWFLRRPEVTSQSIDEWNALSIKLGSAGHPGYFTLMIVKWFLYPKSRFSRPNSIFEAIAIDESLQEPILPPETTAKK